MQKYKLKQDSSALNKGTKHPFASIGSNKSLLKQLTSNQNKSTLSVVNSTDVNHSKSLRHRNKSSKHLQSHTFTNNTHQNSVNIPAFSNSHNNSKSNKKCQNQNKKSTGKKLTSINTQSKLLAETSHGRSSSQYQNLLIQPNSKNQAPKNYKNILKIRKQTKEQQPLNQHKQQGVGLKSHKDLKHQQNHQKSINVSSFKDLKKKKSKSRSKSKQFQTMNKKLNQSKKHLIAQKSNITSQQNNMNQVNQRKSQGRKKTDKVIKLHSKQKGVVILNGQGKECKEKKLNEHDSEDYERVPLCMLKSSTNSEIQFSNNDQNTVKQLIRQQKVTNKTFFYAGQADDVVFCKDTYQYGQEEMMRKQESNKLSKRYSKMNLRLSSECLNCLTEPDYSIEPKGIRHRNPNMSSNEQEILSSKQTSQFSSKLEKSSQKKLISKFKNGKQTVNEQTMHKSATIIQKVWRGYMTRKLLQKFIQEQEVRLFQRMRQIGEMKRQMMENAQIHEQVDVKGEKDEEDSHDDDQEEEAIKIVEQELVQQSLGNVNYSDNTVEYSQHQITTSSMNGLDYESQILARDDGLSFIVQLNTMGSKHTHPQPSSKRPINQSIDEVHYTEVQSIDHLSKVENICEEGEYSIVGNSGHVDETFNGENGSDLIVDEDEEQDLYEQEVQAHKQNSYSKLHPISGQQEALKKFTFFDNHEVIENQNDISRSYQESSYTEPSSIFFRPVQNSRDISSIHKISFSKDQGDSYIINDHQQSYRIQESMEEESSNHFNIIGKSLNQEESSYCLGDETEIYMQNVSDPIKKDSVINENYFGKSKQIIQNIEESYKIDDQPSVLEKQKLSEIVPEKIISEKVILQKQVISQPLPIQSLITNKSNPNILLIKSPKHQSLSKSYFSQSKSHKKVNQKDIKENIKKTSSLKEFFFKKSLLGNESLNEKQEIQLPILSFSSHKFNLLSFPAQKEASSIKSLLHFRHQCLTHQHSKEFRQIQELYVKQKISKQDFILRLHQLASHFEESAVQIKQAQKDIFNGYKALLKLIKDVLKDCKMLGLSQQKGSNVRFCRSMEIFFREKDKISNQKCVFDDEYLWRFDDVMIDELQKIKFRVFQNTKSQKSEKKSQVLESGKVEGGKIEQQRGSITSQFSVCKKDKDEIIQKDHEQKKSPILEEKQLLRQSLSHHQLPQLFFDNKSEKETSSLTAPKKLSSQKIENYLNKQKEPFEQPCSFDISELGSCDDYFDEDELSEVMLNKNKIAQQENLKTMRQNKVSPCVQDLNESDSYDIDEDSLDGEMRHQELKVGQEQKSSETDQIVVTLPEPKEQQDKPHINRHIDSIQQIDIRTTQLKLSPDIHLVINNKNREFLQRENDDQDLLDSDDAEVLPVIKRQVYQLSCDSDQEEETFVDKWETQEQTHQIHFFSKEKKVDSSSASFNRSMSLSLYDKKVPEEEESHFSKKYSPLADFVQQIVIWEFIQEIVINKNKLQPKNGFGKKINEFAKKNVSLTQDYLVNFNNDDGYLGQGNVVIISNDQNQKKNKRKANDQTQKSAENSRESLSKISCQEINAFLRILYQQFPTFEENKSKLVQRMYPSPIQLLISLRDSSIQDYFDGSRRKRKHTSDENWQNGQKNENEEHEFDEKYYSDHSNMDSQTSYLELGSYEFLLSQQLCEFLIEKYISQVYDIEMQRKLKAEKEGNEKIKTIKREFNDYLELKGATKSGDFLNKNEENVLSPSKIPKQGSFQSIIRTRELFLQHKEIQSLMLRKEILKIELHTILDSMNQQLIKERQSKSGYSGIGLSELALGTIQRTGIEVKTQEDYAILTTKAKYRLQKFVLNEQVNLNDKLLLECQQSVTINDSQWIFYVTQALQFGLQIAKIVQELLWEETVREISKMQLKRKFRIDDCWAFTQRANVVKEEQVVCEGGQKPMMRGKKVISINIVDSSQKEYSPIKDQQILSIKQFNPNIQAEEQSSQNHSQRSFQKKPQNSEQEEGIINLPLQRQFDKIRHIEFISTVRNQNARNGDENIASTSPIQDEGQLSNLNDSPSGFDYHFSHRAESTLRYNCDLDQSGIMMPKLNDQSKSFDDSHLEQVANFYETTQKMQIEILNQNNEQSGEDDGSYKLDEDSMQFDEELDKELDEMNDD